MLATVLTIVNLTPPSVITVGKSFSEYKDVLSMRGSTALCVVRICLYNAPPEDQHEQC